MSRPIPNDELQAARDRMAHAQTAVADCLADMQRCIDNVKVQNAAMTDAFLGILIEINRNMQARKRP